MITKSYNYIIGPAVHVYFVKYFVQMYHKVHVHTIQLPANLQKLFASMTTGYSTALILYSILLTFLWLYSITIPGGRIG
jgi:hypothetical protein